jgi:hypothetical protein
MTSTPLLALPEFTKQFVVEIDTSDGGGGGSGVDAG